MNDQALIDRRRFTVREQVPEVKPMAEGFFAGRLDFGKLPFLYRIIAKAIGEPEADYRRWEAIKTWAGGLVPLFEAA